MEAISCFLGDFFDSGQRICYNMPITGEEMDMRTGICGILAVLLIFSLLPAAQAQETARDITGAVQITGTGYKNFDFLTDGMTGTYHTSNSNASLTLECDEGMAGIYLMFDLEYGAYTITDHSTGAVFTAGEYGFLHEYIDLEAAFGTVPRVVTVDFSHGKVRLSEITVYSAGRLPDTVQLWNPPVEGGADLVLFSTHGDDEHLYFAGLLPTYAGQMQYRVQVVYLTDHRNDTNKRTHEMLNGLWKVGVRAYPVFGSFADFRVDSLQGSYERYRNEYGTTREDLLSFVTEQIRRFRPLVAVGHDLKGEYGHGMHRVYADLLTEAVLRTDDPTFFPESAETYGLWQIPKLYLHLYPEQPITLDYDQPLDAFNGMTAFEVSQKLGFPSHKSQQRLPMFVEWLYGENGQITKASQITKYSPCQFGLYHSTVGEDVRKDDLFENILTYEQQKLEQERLEQERLEQERLEQERLEQERLEQERLEQQRLEQQRLEQELQAKQQAALEVRQNQRMQLCILLGCAVAVMAAAGLLLARKYRK